MFKYLFLILLSLTGCSTTYQKVKIKSIDLNYNITKEEKVFISKKDNGVAPNSKELLSPIYQLTDNCKNVFITEWRNENLKNKLELAYYVNYICNNAVIKYANFMQENLTPTEKDILKSYNIYIPLILYPKLNISILPSEGDIGEIKRNLNDNYRFIDTGADCITFKKFKCNDEPKILIGLYLYSKYFDYIFIGRKASEKENFARVFYHEIHHALSKQSSLKTALSLRRSEELAEQFSIFLTKEIEN